MISNPGLGRPTYGLVSNGGYFMFLKVLNQGEPQYALSDDFSLYRHRNDLVEVLKGLKRISQRVTAQP
jgi:hypothetical protein